MKFFARAISAGFHSIQLQTEAAGFPGSSCQILDGRFPAQHLLTQAINLHQEKKRKTPCLAAILVGDNPASAIYVRNKIKKFTAAGFMTRLFTFTSQETSTKHLLAVVDTLNHDTDVDGILVQLPLPPGFDTKEVVGKIHPQKDVDGFTITNMGYLASGDVTTGLIACTPLGIMILLQAYGIKVEGKHVVIVGRSQTVGRPLALLLLAENATVTIAHSATHDLTALCKSADIIVAAAGHRALITQEHVSPGAIVIDVGINKNEDGTGICGDVHPEVKYIAGALTPVPGGVGPMTIATLLLNTALATTGWCP